MDDAQQLRNLEALHPPVVVMDVESVGLHGEGFAVGAVACQLGGQHLKVYEFFFRACDPHCAAGAPGDLEWVLQNVPISEKGPPLHRPPTHGKPEQVRTTFWEWWCKWAERGALLVGDCAWPVEANFLSACIADDPQRRAWEGPYPLLDLSTLLWAMGKDPKAKYEREPDELPEHDPVADAQQSARLLTEAWWQATNDRTIAAMYRESPVMTAFVLLNSHVHGPGRTQPHVVAARNSLRAHLNQKDGDGNGTSGAAGTR